MALTSESDLISQVGLMLSRDAGSEDHPSPAVVAELGSLALLEVSRLSPRTVTDTLSGNGSSYSFALSLLSPAWVTGFSYLKSIEYPTGSQSPAWLDISTVLLYPDEDAPTHLRFHSLTPVTGTDNISLVYVVPHTLDTTSTLDDYQSKAVIYFTCAEACLWYSARYEHTTDPTIEADSVDYGTKGARWRELAKLYCGKGYSVLGITSAEMEAQKASAAVSKSSSGCGCISFVPGSIYSRVYLGGS